MTTANNTEPEGGAAGRFTITISNRGGRSFEVASDEPLLDTLEGHGVSLPYGCRYGGCISCAARLLDGAVDQRDGVALNGRQLYDGYVLLCVARPQSDCTLDVGVESHDKLYRNPFQSPLRLEELKPGIRTGARQMEETR
ncbi:MAG: 2Fe-2S iron-sulfur cluster-binding protein [Alphaproteobacteria bacterium]|nr:2Fe-2S iron-sulfur cluster-binding protein [Alphaproteobacteria bacterium]